MHFTNNLKSYCMDKWLQQLHFVIKAKAYLTGELAMRALAKKQVHYVIIASDTSMMHQQAILERVKYYQIPWIVALNKEEMSNLTGKKQVVMLAIINENLAKTLQQKER